MASFGSGLKTGTALWLVFILRSLPDFREPVVAARASDGAAGCLQRFAYALLGERRGVDRVVDEPRPVIVPEVMIRVGRIKPNS